MKNNGFKHSYSIMSGGWCDVKLGKDGYILRLHNGVSDKNYPHTVKLNGGFFAGKDLISSTCISHICYGFPVSIVKYICDKFLSGEVGCRVIRY